ncbi:TPA: hypothetical protein ACV4T5_004448 [Yersinia enterocolitica]
MMSKELEYTRKPDGGLADQIEVLEAFADGDADNTELLMLLIELRSLREQLAELKALPPIGQVISCNGNKTLGWINDAPVGTLLFTAAKPADSVTLPAPANYEDYGPMVSLEKTMAALALCGIEYIVKK